MHGRGRGLLVLYFILVTRCGTVKLGCLGRGCTTQKPNDISCGIGVTLANRPTNPSHPFSLYIHGLPRLPRLPPTTTTTAATATVFVSAGVAKPAVSYADVPRSILLPANKPHQRDPSDQPEHETRYPPAGPLPGPATTRTAPARPSDPTPFPLALQRICNAERVTHLSSLPR